MSEKFRVSPLHLVPELWTLILTGVLAYSIMKSNVEIEAITIFPETASGVTLNALSFVLLMAGTATIMYVLVKRGLNKVVKLLIKLALVFAIFTLVSWYAEIYSNAIGLSIELYQIPLASILFTAALFYATYRSRSVVQILAITIIGALTGTFLGASIPTLTALVLVGGLAIYDVIAVFKGPIGKMAEKTEIEEFVGAVFTFRDLTVGLGDVVFYSMLASNAMVNFGLTSFMATSFGITLGTYVGFKMLESREMFPGLPFSLTLGLVFLFVSIYLQRIIPLF